MKYLYEKPESDNQKSPEGHNSSLIGLGFASVEILDNDWQRLKDYLSVADGGPKRFNKYKQWAREGVIPTETDQVEVINQWFKDLHHAGIFTAPSQETPK
jgi:hypothetical protein